MGTINQATCSIKSSPVDEIISKFITELSLWQLVTSGLRQYFLDAGLFGAKLVHQEKAQ